MKPQYKISIVLIFIMFIATMIFKVFFLSKELDELQAINKHKVNYPSHPNTIALTREDLLDVIPENILTAGKAEMAKHKLIITAIARDNAQDFSIMVRNIENIGSYFADYRVLIFENDSSDGTKQALEAWRINNPKVDYISHDFNNKKRPSIKFMAECRNQYIDGINDPKYDDFDIMMAIDMDFYKGVDIRGIEDSFSKINQWDGVCSNGVRSSDGDKLYDVFAFRNDEFPWSPKQWEAICVGDGSKWVKICEAGIAYRGYWQYFKAKWLGGSSKFYWALILPQIRMQYVVTLPLIPVKSCFGGMAFYKRDFIKDCRYDSIDGDCEHVEFHKCLREKNNGIMMMNPAQIIRYD